ncbi:branched-chain amino acid transport system substrate-binding protein [Streptomyces sp. V4I23]|uniref:ABC transporter substrate-binding protein n=1 Tax=Streptomyces sp. V4I23 TaxID=3042282 RepID=UPI00278A71E0|nr:ABC transporter substrate-binding protein [Streptomyces sp. V4I23]MDQ1006623.1 branched-chain amino acid transport system substrate-binding protein [Streptomyces sp. V4I23]
MIRRRSRQIGVAAVALAFAVVSGCGQKPGVSGLYAGPGGPSGQGTAAGELGGVGTDGQPVDPGALDTGAQDVGAGAGTDAAGTGAGNGAGTGTGTGGTGDRGGSGGGTSGPVPPGIGDPTPLKPGAPIKIGVHAPVTGAAAIPQNSIEHAVGVYADYINKKGGINGRKLQVKLENDNFDPSTAVSKCKSFIEQKYFLVIGSAGADQIDACARYANSRQWPYISGGVHESNPRLGSLNALQTYFAAYLTYEQQAPVITREMRAAFSGQKVGLIVAENDNLDNYAKIQGNSLKQAFGTKLVLNDRAPKKIQAEATSIAAKICNSGAKAVVWNASPGGLVNVSKALTCSVKFYGPGNTSGLNVVATGGCPQIDGARFFSSFPQLDRMDSIDPEFRKAYKAKNGGADPDDIAINAWGLEKLVGQMLQAAGKNLSHRTFMATLNSGKTFDAGVFPSVKFAPNKRFGGSAMYLLEADCGSRQYKTRPGRYKP